MRARMTASGGAWLPRYRLHPEKIAPLDEEPVAGATQALEAKRVGLVERGAVPEEQHGAGRGPVGKEEVVAEVVDGAAAGRADALLRGRVEHERCAGARVDERAALLREVLADVAEENRPRQLVLELQARDVGGRETAAVPRARDALMRPQRVHAHRLRGAPGDRRLRVELEPLRRFGEDRHRAVPGADRSGEGAVRRGDRRVASHQIVQPVRLHERRSRAVDGVADVRRAVEALLLDAAVQGHAPAAPQVGGPGIRETSLDRALEMPEL